MLESSTAIVDSLQFTVVRGLGVGALRPRFYYIWSINKGSDAGPVTSRIFPAVFEIEAAYDADINEPYPTAVFYRKYGFSEVGNRIAHDEESQLLPILAFGWGIVMIVATAVYPVPKPRRPAVPFRFEHERHDNEARKHYRELREQEYGGAG